MWQFTIGNQPSRPDASRQKRHETVPIFEPITVNFTD